jgi:arylformamidase
MNIIDISWPISPMITAYKNKKTVSVTPTKVFAHDHVRESLVTLGTHTGTHLDTPAHFLEHGTTTEHINLNQLIGPCTVIDFTHVTDMITASDFEKIPLPQHHIVLLKTHNSNHGPEDPFDPNFIYLSASGAQWLVDHQAKAVGIDYLGIERNQPRHETHTLLLSNNMLIIEGLRLGEVIAGNYMFYCLPLALQGLESAPARAILMKNKH